MGKPGAGQGLHQRDPGCPLSAPPAARCARQIPRRVHRRDRPFRFAVLQHLAARSGNHRSAGAPVPGGDVGGAGGCRLLPGSVPERGSRRTPYRRVRRCGLDDVSDGRRGRTARRQQGHRELVHVEHRESRFVFDEFHRPQHRCRYGVFGQPDGDPSRLRFDPARPMRCGDRRRRESGCASVQAGNHRRWRPAVR